MALFGKKYNSALVRDTDSATRESEILALEGTREQINREIEELLFSYRKLTGKKKATRGAKKIGSTVKDYSYWHEFL